MYVKGHNIKSLGRKKKYNHSKVFKSTLIKNDLTAKFMRKKYKNFNC